MKKMQEFPTNLFGKYFVQYTFCKKKKTCRKYLWIL